MYTDSPFLYKKSFFIKEIKHFRNLGILKLLFLKFKTTFR